MEWFRQSVSLTRGWSRAQAGSVWFHYNLLARQNPPCNFSPSCLFSSCSLNLECPPHFFCLENSTHRLDCSLHGITSLRKPPLALGGISNSLFSFFHSNVCVFFLALECICSNLRFFYGLIDSSKLGNVSSMSLFHTSCLHMTSHIFVAH